MGIGSWGKILAGSLKFEAWAGKAGKVVGQGLHSDFNGHLMGQLKLQAVFAGLTLIGPGSAHDKLHSIASNAGVFYLTMGMRSGSQMQAAGLLLGLTPALAKGARSVVNAYRGALESRYNTYVPFSHSSIAMEQAFSTLQYAQQRLGSAYSNIGGEAGFMAARYMTR